MPLSLLELNTLGHALCALLIYMLWWEKPLDVDYPTILSGQTLWDFCALIWMRYEKSPVVSAVIDYHEAYVHSHPRLRTLSKVN